MNNYERRSTVVPTTGTMREVLTVAQLRLLDELEQHGWELGFVRLNKLPAPLMFVYDAGSDRFDVFDAEGNQNDPAAFNIRH